MALNKENETKFLSKTSTEPKSKTLTVHTDFISETFSTFFKSFLDNVKSPIELNFPLESIILKTFINQLVFKGISLKIYKISKDSDYLDNFEVTEVLDTLNKYDKCTFFQNCMERFDPYSYTAGKARRDNLLIENSAYLILGETLICGKGMQLAELAMEKNKKIFCILPDYFSFGFLGSEFLISSNSAQLLHTKFF